MSVSSGFILLFSLIFLGSLIRKKNFTKKCFIFSIDDFCYWSCFGLCFMVSISPEIPNYSDCHTIRNERIPI